MRIAVMPRIAEQRPAAAQQSEIDSPGVHTHAVDAAELSRRLAQPGDHFAVEAQHVPMQGIERGGGNVRKAMHVLQFEATAVEQAEHPAAALGAKIEGQNLAS